MGKSAKLLKRPSKKEKIVKKATAKKNCEIQNEKPTSSEAIKKVNHNLPNGVHPYTRSTPSKRNSTSVKTKSKKASGASKSKILEGRPDYVDLMYGRPKAKKVHLL